MDTSFGGPGIALSDDGNVLALGSMYVDKDDIDAVGAVFVYRYDGVGSWNPEQTIYEDEPGRQHHFGHAVALSGDQLVSTSFLHNDYQGALWVFRYDGTSWIQESKLQGVNHKAQFGQTLVAGGGVIVAYEGTNDSKKKMTTLVVHKIA